MKSRRSCLRCRRAPRGSRNCCEHGDAESDCDPESDVTRVGIAERIGRDHNATRAALVLATLLARGYGTFQPLWRCGRRNTHLIDFYFDFYWINSRADSSPFQVLLRTPGSSQIRSSRDYAKPRERRTRLITRANATVGAPAVEHGLIWMGEPGRDPVHSNSVQKDPNNR